MSKVDYEHAVKVADTYMQAMSEGDFETVMTLYAEDATLEDPVGSDIKNGKAAIREFYFAISGTDITCTRTGPVRFAGSEMVFPFQCVMKSDEGSMKIDIIDHFVLNQAGEISAMRAFWSSDTAAPV